MKLTKKLLFLARVISIFTKYIGQWGYCDPACSGENTKPDSKYNLAKLDHYWEVNNSHSSHRIKKQLSADKNMYNYQINPFCHPRDADGTGQQNWF